MPAPGPTIETARLILRPPVAADIDGWEVFAGDPETMRFLGGAETRPGAWRQLALTAGTWSLQGFGMFSVVEKASGAWIGRLGPWCPEGWPGTEIGWGFVRTAWGKGYAIEGATAAMDWAVEALGWTDIIHTIAPDNFGSAAVARRLGSTCRGSGRLPAPFQDVRIEIWGQSAAQWKARQASAVQSRS